MVKYIKSKDSDGNLNPYPNVTESWRLVRADADGLGVLFPESVSSTRMQVMRHGSPRYRARPLLGLLSDFPFWGVIRVVPRI